MIMMCVALFLRAQTQTQAYVIEISTAMEYATKMIYTAAWIITRVIIIP